MSGSSSMQACSHCGAVLPEGMPQSRCPRCLMAQVIKPTQAGGQPDALRDQAHTLKGVSANVAARGVSAAAAALEHAVRAGESIRLPALIRALEGQLAEVATAIAAWRREGKSAPGGNDAPPVA